MCYYRHRWLSSLSLWTWSMSRSCGKCRVPPVTNPVIRHEWGKDQEVLARSGTYPRGLLLLTRKLLNHGFLIAKLKSSLRKSYGRHHDLVDRYGISVSQMTMDMFHNPTKIGGELRCSGKVNSSCSISGARRVNLVTNLVMSWMRKGLGSVYDKWNISVVICDTDL
jgi:hypothetical protein